MLQVCPEPNVAFCISESKIRAAAHFSAADWRIPTENISKVDSEQQKRVALCQGNLKQITACWPPPPTPPPLPCHANRKEEREIILIRNVNERAPFMVHQTNECLLTDPETGRFEVKEQLMSVW